ncbi:MAG: zinc-ribbon domain-containing protein [Myxococcales bacterium]|nr:zinc-ribbon domain-containing protein [Myxococcales bacterium]
MKIVCDSCGAKYSIADEKVAGKIFKIRCKKCSSVLEVRGDQTNANAGNEQSVTSDRGGEATWYIVVDGEQKGPLAPIDLSQLFAKGSVGLESYVWNEGFDDWRVASDVPELAQLFGGAVSQAKPQAAADDTLAFGAGGDLFGNNDGREPTSEIDTNSSMFAGFDDSPTPTPAGVENSPVAAGSNDAGASPGGGALGASVPERMTGQRNENSVLFSLSNLQQLASRGGSPAESASMASQPPSASLGAQSAPPPSGEGSGLIDIRALAKSTTPGTRAAPSQAVDDLLAIGTGGGAAFGAPLLGPAPDETSYGNRWLWIGGIAIAVIAIVGAGVGVGMALGGSEEDALEITTANQAAPSVAIPGSNAVAASARAPIEPPDEALAAGEVAEPVEAATIEDNAPEPAPELVEPAPKKRSASNTQRRPRSAKGTTSSSPEPAPAPRKRSGNLDALMDEVVGGSASTTKPKKTSASSSRDSSSLPDAPSRNDVKTALQGVSGGVKACKKDSGGTATVNVTFSGKTGRASGAKVASGPFKGTPVGSCIESAVRRARVPRFKQSSFKVTFPYRL